MHETYREIQNLGVIDPFLGNLNKNWKFGARPQIWQSTKKNEWSSTIIRHFGDKKIWGKLMKR